MAFQRAHATLQRLPGGCQPVGIRPVGRVAHISLALGCALSAIASRTMTCVSTKATPAWVRRLTVATEGSGERHLPIPADRGVFAGPDQRMVPAAPKGFLVSPSHRRAPRMPACPAPRDWSFMVAPPLAAVLAVIAVGRTAPASAGAAQPTRPHGKKIFLIATPYPYACRPPARAPLTRDARAAA